MSKKDKSARLQRIREELWETFRPELEELTESLEQQLLSLENDMNNLELIAALFRTMHTLKGSCGMMGFTKIEELTHQAEDVMDMVRDQQLQLTPELMELFFETLDTLKAGQELIVKTKTDAEMEIPEAILQGLKGFLNAEPPQSSEGSSSDDDIWNQLALECIDQLDDSESLCLDLESNPDNTQSIDSLFRNIHTIKGSFNLAGLEKATQLLHSAEDLIGLCRDNGKVHNPKIIDSLFFVIDQVRTHLKDNKQQRKDIEDIQQTLKDLNVLLEYSKSDSAQERNSAFSHPSDNDLVVASGDGQIVIDEEYLKLFFEMVWQSLNQVKALLQEHHNFTQCPQDIIDAVDSVYFASEQMQLDRALLALSNYKTILIQQDVSHNSVIKETNALWHFFWDLEEELYQNLGPDGLRVETDNPSPQPELSTTQRSINQTVEISSNDFFDGLWPQLSQLRKLFESISDQEELSSVKQLLDCVKAAVEPVAEFSISEPVAKLESILADGEFNSETLAQIGAQIQEIYTICWDNEDQLEGKKITLNTGKSKVEPKKAALQEPVIATPVSAPEDVSQQETVSIVTENLDQSLEDTGDPLSDKDPLFALDFLQLAQETMSKFQQLCFDWKQGEEESIAHINELFSQLAKNSQLFGFNAIVAILEDFLAQCRATDWRFDSESCKKFELEVFSFLTQIEDAISEKDKNRHPCKLNISHVFKQWHAESFSITVDNFLNTSNYLLQSLKQWMAGSLTDEAINNSLAQLLKLNQSLVLTCQYHELARPEEYLLHVNDVINRAKFDKHILSETIISAWMNLVKYIGSAMDQLERTGCFDYALVAQANERFEKLFTQASSEDVLFKARQLLHQLTLPESLMCVIDDGVLNKVASALDAGEFIYLFFLDVEHDEYLAEQAFKLLNSKLFESIINATDYINDRSVFYFLINSKSALPVLQEVLLKIDPAQDYLKIEPFPTHVAPVAQSDQFDDSPVNELYTLGSDQFNESVESLHGSVCELISIKASLTQATQSIVDFDLMNMLEKHFKDSHGSWQVAKSKIRNDLHAFDDDVKDLLKAQEDVDSILERLQHGVNSIRQAPVSLLLDSISTWFDAYARRGSIEIPLSIEDSELLIERDKLNALNLTLRHLIKALTTHADSETHGQLNVIGACGNQSNEITVCFEQGALSSEALAQIGKPAEQTLTDWVSNRDTLEDDAGDAGINFAEINTQLDLLGFKLVPILKGEELCGFCIKMSNENMIIDGITVKSGNTFYVMPIQLIQRIVNLDDAVKLKASATNQNQMIQLGEEVLPLVKLDYQAQECDKSRRIVLIVSYDDRRSGVIVDELVGLQQILLTPLMGQLKKSNKFQGCAVLGKNRIGMIVNPAALVG